MNQNATKYSKNHHSNAEIRKVYSKSFFSIFIRDIFPEIASLHSTLLRYFHYIFITFGMVVTYRINIDIMPGMYYIECFSEKY